MRPELNGGDRLGVVLQEHVIAALPIDGAAGVVHPPVRGEQVVPRAHGIAGDGGLGERRFIECERGEFGSERGSGGESEAGENLTSVWAAGVHAHLV
jgi:hypothetical protein